MYIEKKSYIKRLRLSFVFGCGLTFIACIIALVIAQHRSKFNPMPYAAFQASKISKYYEKLIDGREIPIKLTTYHPNAKECGNNKGVTASGLKIDPLHPQRWLAVGLIGITGIDCGK